MKETGGSARTGGSGWTRRTNEAILDCIEEGIYVLDAAGRVAFVNPAAARMVGWEAEELIGRPQHETVHHSRADGAPYPFEECPIRATLKDGAVRRVSGEVFWRKDGTPFPVEYTASPFREGSEASGAVVSFRDVADRLRAEEALRESEERYRLLVENASDYAMFTVDTDGRVLSWNTGAERVFGYREEAIGKPSSFVFTPEDVRLGAPEEELREAETRGRAEDERWHVRKDGSRFFASGLVEPMRDDAGNLRGFAKIARDVTERKLAEEETRRLYREKSEIASVLQNALLPPRLPEVPGVELAARYVAAGEGVDVGGDFYDVFQAAEGGDSAPSPSWTVVLGDVSGKGPEAAALTSLARHTLRATAARAGGPTRALATLNEEILSQTAGERFFSVVLGELRPDGARGARLTLVRGGHPAPLLLRAAGGSGAAVTVEELGEPGTVLGIRPDPKLPESMARLRPGDAAVFYTDGVTEARSPGGDFFGEEGLRALLESCAGLSAEEIAEKLEAKVLAFQRRVVRDDAAILILRVSDDRGDG